jgi:hypothetical protein
MALMVLIILIAFVATVWVRRQHSNMKNLGHYNGELLSLFNLHKSEFFRRSLSYFEEDS